MLFTQKHLIICASLLILLFVIIARYFIIQIIKRNKKSYIFNWFQKDAIKNGELHVKSGWGYMSQQTFNEIINDWMSKMDPPIKDGEKVFEMGCGVGAILKHIQNSKQNVIVSGSDISPKAIEVANQELPNSTFYCLNMTESHPIPSNSQDHVISAGALGMYLYKNDMIKAIKEAVRITKPGGSLCFTHFIEPRGKRVGSIIEKVEESFWVKHQNELNIDNIRFYTLKNQGDRYYFVCNKRR